MPYLNKDHEPSTCFDKMPLQCLVCPTLLFFPRSVAFFFFIQNNDDDGAASFGDTSLHGAAGRIRTCAGRPHWISNPSNSHCRPLLTKYNQVSTNTAYTDPVQPSTNQSRLILTQYLQVPTSTALY